MCSCSIYSSMHNWIQKALGKHKGALHRALHVPAGRTIPMSLLQRATHNRNPRIRKRANLALTLRKMHK